MEQNATLKRIFIYLLLAALFFGVAQGMQRTVNNNFVNEVLKITADQFGIIESIREIPGLLCVLLLAAVSLLYQSLAMVICMLLVAVGLFLHSQASGLTMLAVATIIYSVGFHLYMPLQSAMVLKIADIGEKGKRLGQMESARVLGYFIAMGIVYLISDFIDLRTMFILASIIALPAVIFLFLLPREKNTSVGRRTIIFDKKYKLFYILSLCGGSRMHIYQAFATFAFVKIYGMPVGNMALLLMASSLIALFTRPLLGQLTDKYGEQLILTLNYSMVALVFLGYAFINYLPILYVLYCLDNVLFGASVGVRTFMGKVAPADELASHFAMGSTVQHIAGVLVPALGGLVWTTFGYQATFIAGAILAGVSVFFTTQINKTEQELTTQNQMMETV